MKSRRRITFTFGCIRMNHRIAITTIIFALTLSATGGLTGATQHPEKLTFTMQLCGIGAFSAHQIYSVSDGTTLNVESEMYMTLDKAKRALAKELKAAKAHQQTTGPLGRRR